MDVRRVLERLETAWKLIEPRLKIAEDLESGFVQADSWQLTRALASIILHARSRKNYGGFLTLYSLGDSALAVELSGAEMNK